MLFDARTPALSGQLGFSNAAAQSKVAWGFGLSLLLLLLSFSTPARADFLVCNQTLDVVNVAIGEQEDQTFRTEGWWTVGSNQCATVIREDLTVRYVYVYANDVFGQPILDGTTPMCIGSGRFTIEGTEDCWKNGYREADFVEVDTKATSHWTLFLNSPPGD